MKRIYSVKNKILFSLYTKSVHKDNSIINTQLNYLSTTNNNNDNKAHETSYEVKEKFYKMCLANSNQYGWSKKNLSISAENLNYSPMMGEGVFPNGVSDIIFQLMDSFNKDLKKHYNDNVLCDVEKQTFKYIISEQNIKEGLKFRLMSLSPYIKNWPEAMKQGISSPYNLKTVIEKHLETINIILNATETNIGFEGEIIHEKSQTVPLLFKISLVKTLVLAELYMLTDRSNNFKQTFKILDQMISFNLGLLKSTTIIPTNIEVFISLVMNSLMALVPYDLNKINDIIIEKEKVNRMEEELNQNKSI